MLGAKTRKNLWERYQSSTNIELGLILEAFSLPQSYFIFTGVKADNLTHFASMVHLYTP